MGVMVMGKCHIYINSGVKVICCDQRRVVCVRHSSNMNDGGQTRLMQCVSNPDTQDFNCLYWVIQLIILQINNSLDDCASVVDEFFSNWF